MSALSALRGVRSVLYSNLFVTLPIPDKNINLSNQTIIVTGSNTGLGYETSQHLLQLGLGKLIMAVRNESKGQEAKKTLLAATKRPEASIEVWSLDMDSYESVKQFASNVAQLPRIDGVLANAGIMTTQFTRSEGSEKTLNVNVISTFLLYALLLPKMRESSRKTGNICRFVVPNSDLHFMAPLGELQPGDRSILDRLNDEKTSNMGGRYPLSKLLVLYVVRELAARSSATEKGSLIINTPNPSFCKSNLAQENEDQAGFKIFEKAIARSTEEGSRVLVHGLLAGQESHGQFMSNCQVTTPSCHVTGSWGQEVQSRLFKELVGKLESIQPGITARL